MLNIAKYYIYYAYDPITLRLINALSRQSIFWRLPYDKFSKLVNAYIPIDIAATERHYVVKLNALMQVLVFSRIIEITTISKQGWAECIVTVNEDALNKFLGRKND